MLLTRSCHLLHTGSTVAKELYLKENTGNETDTHKHHICYCSFDVHHTQRQQPLWALLVALFAICQTL